MSDYLDVLAKVAQVNVESGYYDGTELGDGMHLSLKKALSDCPKASVIAEIKCASPSAGTIRESVDAAEVAIAMQRGGASALSVLTEPNQFSGSLDALTAARRAVKLPILMKDIVVSPVQVQAAQKMGANAVLLIQALFDRGYMEKTAVEMIAGAHMLGLEVLLETHTSEEFQTAVKTEADLIGVNNRNLATLKVDLHVTKKILSENNSNGKLIISESGIKTPKDIVFLQATGAKAFLVGSSIMSSNNIEEKVREFVNAK
jgi:indole-3-glycerol phosphate synthase